ncbi:hypothetical protein PPACK8108_LOCUS3350 [Phakopsora pachyrhizi]|uniref:Secreted protein n=1 Tax=Phakopsora pachyrhizi TaxID=170000 RepID=A0AAV0ANH4_PHAPC|nr:hypothetical protein PPACK8108_LOCUS3350 [Phakopsora pachyrhizi]
MTRQWRPTFLVLFCSALPCVTGVSQESRWDMGLGAQNRLIKLLAGTGIRMKKQELNCITGSSNEIGLNEGQSQWVVVIRGVLRAEVYPEVSKWTC